MKYLFLGLLVLALLLAFCLWSDKLLSKRLQAVISPLEQALKAAEAGDLALAEHLCKTASKRWDQSYPGLAAFLDHKSIDDLSLAFSILEAPPKEDFLPQMRSLLTMLRGLKEADLPTLQNLL